MNKVTNNLTHAENESIQHIIEKIIYVNGAESPFHWGSFTAPIYCTWKEEMVLRKLYGKSLPMRIGNALLIEKGDITVEVEVYAETYNVEGYYDSVGREFLIYSILDPSGQEIIHCIYAGLLEDIEYELNVLVEDGYFEDDREPDPDFWRDSPDNY